MKQRVPLIVATVFALAGANVAQAHVSIGIGFGFPIAPTYPVYPSYYAPPPVVTYAPPPVVYVPPPVYYPPPRVTIGGYWGPSYPYWRGHSYGRYRHH